MIYYEITDFGRPSESVPLCPIQGDSVIGHSKPLLMLVHGRELSDLVRVFFVAIMAVAASLNSLGNQEQRTTHRER